MEYVGQTLLSASSSAEQTGVSAPRVTASTSASLPNVWKPINSVGFLAATAALLAILGNRPSGSGIGWPGDFAVPIHSAMTFWHFRLLSEV